MHGLVTVSAQSVQNSRACEQEAALPKGRYLSTSFTCAWKAMLKGPVGGSGRAPALCKVWPLWCGLIFVHLSLSFS